MTTDKPYILIINGGSSTIRFALYTADKTITRLFHGKMDRIGLKGSTLTNNIDGGNQNVVLPIDASDNKMAAAYLMNWLEKQVEFASVKAVAHRIVHGMHHTKSERITPELLDELRRIIPYDPDHLPNEIELIETFLEHYPKLKQIADLLDNNTLIFQNYRDETTIGIFKFFLMPVLVLNISK